MRFRQIKYPKKRSRSGRRPIEDLNHDWHIWMQELHWMLFLRWDVFHGVMPTLGTNTDGPYWDWLSHTSYGDHMGIPLLPIDTPVPHTGLQSYMDSISCTM